jgi:hypothetical protein
MRTINLADVSPKRRYTADPKYPECSNAIIDRLIELIENGETFTQDTCCIVGKNANCVVSVYSKADKVLFHFVEKAFEKAGNPVYIDNPNLKMQIFRWNNIYYYLTY